MCVDCAYLNGRADEERRAASISANPKAKQCHIDMAEAYQRQVRKCAAQERRSALHLVGAVANPGKF